MEKSPGRCHNGRQKIQQRCLLTSISIVRLGDLRLLLMRPITCHMDPTDEQVEIHIRVEGHLMDARVQGE